MDVKDVKEYYLQESLLRYYQLFGQNREVVPVIKGSHYVSRPSYLPYDTDYKLYIMQGATSFHASVEKWRNVLKLRDVQEDKEKMDELRIGWDIIIDIDAKRSIEDAKIVAKTLVDFLRDTFEIKPVYIKFSGSRGFHLGISGESLPESIDGVERNKLYPELLHKISIYLKEKLYDMLCVLLRVRDLSQVVEIESNWSYRHLFRMPYSVNEKTYLISEVIDYEDLMDFKMEDASMRYLETIKPYLDKPSKGDVEGLCYEALEYYEDSLYKKVFGRDIQGRIETRKKGIDNPDEITLAEINAARKELAKISGFNVRVEKEFFPKTILNILQGLQDGRKRGIFILLNFLRKMNWSWDEIEKEIEEWNGRNAEPLRESYIRTQINYFKKNENKIKNIPPPNFETEGYYDDMGVLEREDLNLGVRNPVTYAYKMKALFLKKRKGVKNEDTHYRYSRNRKNKRK